MAMNRASPRDSESDAALQEAMMQSMQEADDVDLAAAIAVSMQGGPQSEPSATTTTPFIYNIITYDITVHSVTIEQPGAPPSVETGTDDSPVDKAATAYKAVVAADAAKARKVEAVKQQQAEQQKEAARAAAKRVEAEKRKAKLATKWVRMPDPNQDGMVIEEMFTTHS